MKPCVGSIIITITHAVVLTELIPDTLLDRSPGIVIELNVC